MQAQIRNLVKAVLPRPLIKAGQTVYFSIQDSVESALGLRDDLTPPKRLIFIGDGDFKQIGKEFFDYFTKYGDLKPSDNVLDVGCGIGRMAIPLTNYLNEQGRYEGFDIVDYGIQWCTKKITPKFPNFHFQLADVYNKLYHESGKYQSSEYQFPYADEEFDFIFLTSVFTHMLPPDMENYLSEISRVLKPGGRCLITFFLINNDSEKCIQQDKSKFTFSHKYENHQVNNIDMPEYAVSYKEDYVVDLFAKYNLSLPQPILYGSWCGRDSYTSFQDLIIGEKKGSAS